ncbi:hypothetical protein D3C78_1686580 [compost metagenome]
MAGDAAIDRAEVLDHDLLEFELLGGDLTALLGGDLLLHGEVALLHVLPLAVLLLEGDEAEEDHQDAGEQREPA